MNRNITRAKLMDQNVGIAKHCVSGGAGSAIKAPIESLPKQFVTSMKTLFDILDDQRSGLVKFADIEHRWQDDGSKGLPVGVIDSLRKVTPSNGMLSFERFCAGLKICLLRNQSDGNQTRHESNLVDHATATGKPKSTRPPSTPLLDIDNPLPNSKWVANANNTATVRPNNVIHPQRTLSMPQLSPDSVSDIENMPENDIYVTTPPPPKPPRTAIITAPNNPIDKAEIRHALQNWQMGILMNEMDAKDKRKSTGINRIARGTADGGVGVTVDPVMAPVIYQKKVTPKRREPRRHTLQNGIDYNMLKRLKQFEEERDVLLQGLTAVEKAREWYLQQIAVAQEKIKYLGRMGSHVEQWSEVHQERLDFQRARVLEINRHLSTLADTWERGGLPMHMNLAVRHVSQVDSYQLADRLKQHNRLLAEEIRQKNNRIELLEREKQNVIREFGQHQRASAREREVNSSSSGNGDAHLVY